MARRNAAPVSSLQNQVPDRSNLEDEALEGAHQLVITVPIAPVRAPVQREQRGSERVRHMFRCSFDPQLQRFRAPIGKRIINHTTGTTSTGRSKLCQDGRHSVG